MSDKKESNESRSDSEIPQPEVAQVAQQTKPVPLIENGARAQKLFAAMERFRGKNHLVVLQGTPDPDAISSALALSVIGDAFDINTTIISFAAVSHHENRALLKRLEISLARYDASVDLKTYNIYSIVDSQRADTPIDDELKDADVKFLAFIDHHREDISAPHAMFVDIRPHYSSTAAILCDYLHVMYPKGLEPGDVANVHLATALMHGMRTDTLRFNYATQYEYQAGAFLAPCVDTKVIEIIERKILTSSMMGILENALVNRRVHDNFIFSDVGFVRSLDRDVIPQAAELLLTREGTDTALVWGIVDDSRIDGSFRTRSETINPDEFVKGFLGVSPVSGKYYGGGNVKDRGGFQIPLGFIALHENKNQVYAMAREIIEKSFLDYIGKKAKQD